MGVVTCGALFLLLYATAARAEEPSTSPDTVFCHDTARNIVQRVQPRNCDGRRVDRREAARLREQIRAERAWHFRELPQPNADKRDGRSGTGFHVDRRGHIVTARHVVEDCGRLSVKNDGGAPAEARVLATHPRRDLALLQGHPHRPISLLDDGDTPVAAGEPVRLVGYPLLEVPVTQPIAIDGHLLAVDVERDAAGMVVRAPVRPGYSGGPIIGSSGEVMGLVTGQLDTVAHFQRTGDLERHIGIGIRWDQIRAFLEDHGVQPVPARAKTEPSQAVVRITCRS